MEPEIKAVEISAITVKADYAIAGGNLLIRMMPSYG
jgi:hypothetical protein